jgi:hypothetical protein
VTARLESRQKSSWGGRRKGAGRRPKIPHGDDYEERLAVYEACVTILELLEEEMRKIDPTSRLSFVAYHRSGLERAIEVVERYRASVRMEREDPGTRVKFVA